MGTFEFLSRLRNRPAGQCRRCHRALQRASALVAGRIVRGAGERGLELCGVECPHLERLQMTILKRNFHGLPLWFYGLLALCVFAQWALAARLNLSFDEAYYWLWSQHLQLSYYDHPPLVAWAIRLSTSL